MIFALLYCIWLLICCKFVIAINHTNFGVKLLSIKFVLSKKNYFATLLGGSYKRPCKEFFCFVSLGRVAERWGHFPPSVKDICLFWISVLGNKLPQLSYPTVQSWVVSKGRVSGCASQTVRARVLNFWEKVYHIQPVTCHVWCVICHMSCVTCHMSKGK